MNMFKRRPLFPSIEPWAELLEMFPAGDDWNLTDDHEPHDFEFFPTEVQQEPEVKPRTVLTATLYRKGQEVQTIVKTFKQV